MSDNPVDLINSTVVINAIYDESGCVIDIDVGVFGTDVFGFSEEFIQVGRKSQSFYKVDGHLLYIKDHVFQLEVYWDYPYKFWTGSLLEIQNNDK